MASLVTELVCVACQRSHGPEGAPTTCSACGPEDGILDICYDMDAVATAWRSMPLEHRSCSHWRYRELLPLSAAGVPLDWPVGGTPLIGANRLAVELDVAQLTLKDEGRNPTASLKDRASSVGVAHALEHGAKTVACASTGNAATSLAGHAALSGLPAVIFVPAAAPEPKLAQLLVYGATVIAVEGSYEQAYRLCGEACARFGWYNRNCAINPVLVEGKKTAGLEIAEQCRTLGGIPEWVAVSIGDGCTIAGIWKGMVEMQRLGTIDRLPRLLGVQVAGVAPVHHALRHGTLPEPNRRRTLADSINVQVPRNWRKAVAALRASDGVITLVTDDQILKAMRMAGRHGMFAEPAAAAAVAGVAAARQSGVVRSRDRVLAVITGSGLKDTRAAMQATGRPLRIAPQLDALAAALEKQGGRASGRDQGAGHGRGAATSQY